MKMMSLLASVLLCIGLNGRTRAEEVVYGESERLRMELNEKFDRMGLRFRDTFVTDSGGGLLEMPEGADPDGDFLIAGTPPRVEFMVVPDREPEYLPDGEAYMDGGSGFWANWGHVTRSDDGRFFFSASDHVRTINLYEYCPDRDLVHTVLNVDELLGWTESTLTDGKIHGHMGIMPDGTLWAGTHFGDRPDSTWWASGYRGSWLLSYNIFTHEARNWGVPLVGNWLPCFTVDTRRGRLVGTGAAGTMLSWDCINHRVRFAGYPPHGWIWQRRAMFLDRDTGIFWSFDGADERSRFLSFDPEFNTFVRHEVPVPPNPLTGVTSILRGHTERPAIDGWYYWATHSGALFRFRPGDSSRPPQTETAGVTWDRGCDALQLALSPDGRYVYYLPTSGEMPVVRYDVETGRRTVICFLGGYYFETYGYTPGACYGLDISEDGSFLFMVTNGGFQGPDRVWGHPGIFVVHLPDGG